MEEKNVQNKFTRPSFQKKNGFSRRLSLATNITKKTYSYQNLDSYSDNKYNNKNY